MCYAVKQDPETVLKEHQRDLDKMHDRAKTRRGALHRHNAPGTKLKKRLFKAKNGRAPLRSELEKLVRCGKEFRQPQKQEGNLA